MDYSEFTDICPYTDEQVRAALASVADHPYVTLASQALFPEKDAGFLAGILKDVGSVDEFQQIVIARGIEWVISNTVKEFTYDGVENIKALKSRFLAVSNHRDIVLDPAVTQLVFFRNGLDTSQLCVGDNLLKNEYIEKLLRSNKMIKVIRGINARTLYLSSQLLSKYIRQTISSGTSSVWIAQREGRAKFGLDKTEQGLLKMFDMSGTSDFVSNFAELNMLPLSISYQYEPCDIMKARELLISRSRKYVKGENEDVMSIVSGIKEYKGNVHLHIGTPISTEEIEDAARFDKNERYKRLRTILDNRIISGYRLWDTNYMGYDLMKSSSGHAAMYSPEDMEKFKAYIESRLDMVEPELSRDDLREILLGIYGNPVEAAESLGCPDKAEKEAD